ncbi:MAG: rhomboid protease GluP [Chloroflexota bacterium]|jgi:membrane associated rhomboid family serine protease|nr:rhomboid protease GluP [Chloroflexota bacterium]
MANDPPTVPASDPRDTIERARLAAESGDFETAAALYQRGVGNPDPQLHVAALLGLADARYRLDDEQGALQAWLTATMAPETPLAWRAWVALAGARVREGDLSGAARCYREAEARAPTDEKAAIQSRLGWLNKELGNKGAANRYFGRARGGFTPLVTYGIIAVTIAVSLLQATPVGGQPLVNLLQLDKQQVMQGEYWRLITVALVHGGMLHLLFNVYALWIVGPLAEALYGRAMFLAIYLTAAVGGSVASYLVLPNPAVGASGAIFGLFGLVFASTYFHKTLLRPQARAITGQIGMLIVLNLVIGFGIGGFAQIDNSAHIGGLLVGGWLGLLIAPGGAATLSSLWQRKETSTEGRSVSGRLLRVLGIVALGLVLVGALLIKPFWA